MWKHVYKKDLGKIHKTKNLKVYTLYWHSVESIPKIELMDM